jgi:D-sedoheptulose 7-phosphate isomerase
MSSLESLLNNIHASIDSKQAFLKCDHSPQLFERCVVAVLDSYQSGGRLYIAGNGGSAADAHCKQASA